MTFALLSIAVFLSALALDVADVWHKIAVEKRDPHASARMSVAMYAIGCVGFFSVVTYSWWLMIPECLGLYVGSVLAFRRKSSAKNDSDPAQL